MNYSENNKTVNQVINFNEVYTRYYSSVLNFISAKINGKREIAEEITQDTFIKVYEHLNSYNSEKSVISTWIFNIALRKLIDHYRSDKSAQMVGVDGFVDENGEPTYQFKDTEKADNTVDSEEKLSAINRAMNVLNSNEKKIAELYFIKQMKYTEISEQLDAPMGTVKALINRVRSKLQYQLKGIYKMA
jgi:RNA polymerase sigma-70 factor (ECF subfamily)